LNAVRDGAAMYDAKEAGRRVAVLAADPSNE
jgi:hypothetical protein